jgi:CRP/FNR family transcriptional regulator, cyclic AMP receptor protein
LGRADLDRAGSQPRVIEAVDTPSDPADRAGANVERRGRRARPVPTLPVKALRAAEPAGAPATSFILAEDPELAQGLPPDQRRAATALFRAQVVSINRPRWQPPDYEPSITYGLLVLDGLMGRRVRVGKAVATELLGPGDILRPWDEPTLWGMIPPELDWRVFRPTRLAVLDERITALIGRRHELVISFSGRLLRRARSIAYLTAVSHLNRVEDRLIATLWHIASSWGRVGPEGVSVPFHLTHEVLGEILGAQRPSVTIALQKLQRRQQVTRARGGGYLLIGDPTHWNSWTGTDSSAS